MRGIRVGIDARASARDESGAAHAFTPGAHAVVFALAIAAATVAWIVVEICALCAAGAEPIAANALSSAAVTEVTITLAAFALGVFTAEGSVRAAVCIAQTFAAVEVQTVRLVRAAVGRRRTLLALALRGDAYALLLAALRVPAALDADAIRIAHRLFTVAAICIDATRNAASSFHVAFRQLLGAAIAVVRAARLAGLLDGVADRLIARAVAVIGALSTFTLAVVASRLTGLAIPVVDASHATQQPDLAQVLRTATVSGARTGASGTFAGNPLCEPAWAIVVRTAQKKRQEHTQHGKPALVHRIPPLTHGTSVTPPPSDFRSVVARIPAAALAMAPGILRELGGASQAWNLRRDQR